MTSLVEAAAIALGGGGTTIFAQAVGGWWSGRRDDQRAQREADVKLEEHRDSLTFDLLTAAREEMASLRAEAASLRPLMVHAAHLEEALDHLYAILHADGDLERKAAERRAKAFLKRMRPEPGDKRQAVQTEISAARVIDDAKKGRDV
jgi:hypothetical protein